jgi:hypothetical protein
VPLPPPLPRKAAPAVAPTGVERKGNRQNNNINKNCNDTHDAFVTSELGELTHEASLRFSSSPSWSDFVASSRSDSDFHTNVKDIHHHAGRLLRYHVDGSMDQAALV